MLLYSQPFINLFKGLNTVQNPWKDHPRTVNPPQRAAYPSDYQRLFQGPNAPKSGYMWIPPRVPALLDYKHAVFTLIGRSPNWSTASVPDFSRNDSSNSSMPR